MADLAASVKAAIRRATSVIRLAQQQFLLTDLHPLSVITNRQQQIAIQVVVKIIIGVIGMEAIIAVVDIIEVTIIETTSEEEITDKKRAVQILLAAEDAQTLTRKVMAAIAGGKVAASEVKVATVEASSNSL